MIPDTLSIPCANNCGSTIAAENRSDFFGCCSYKCFSEQKAESEKRTSEDTSPVTPTITGVFSPGSVL